MGLGTYSFDNPWDGVAKGRDLGNALRSDQARRTAGNALTGGDYQTAAGALLGSGDLEAGVSVQRMGQADHAATAQAKRQQEAEVANFTAGLAQHLSDFHGRNGGDVNQTLAAFDQGAQQLRKLGESDADIQQVRASIAANPGATFAALGAAAKQYTLANGGDGYLGAFDPNTGMLKDLHQARQAPIQVDPEKDLYLPDSGGDHPAGPAPHGGGPPPIAPASAPSGPVDIERFRHAIRMQESGDHAGAVGPDTPYGNAEGVGQTLPATAEAMARKIGIPWNPSMMRGKTPAAMDYQTKISNAYIDEALQASGGNPEKAAAYYFGGPNMALHGPKTAQYSKDIMARYQGPAPYQVASTGDTPAPPSDGIPGYRLAQHGRHEPDWQPDGRGNLVNQKTGDRKIDPTADSSVEADPALVRLLISGQYPAPTGRAATAPKWLAALDEAARQDPSFNAADYHTRYKTRTDFTSGASAKNITALNTAIGHVGSLDSKIDALGNTPVPFVNALKNFAEDQTGDPRIRAFNADKKAVASELVRVFRQAGGTEADIQDFQKQLDVSGSPKQLKAVSKEMLSLLTSRLDALATQYTQGLGQAKNGIDFLNPHAAKVYTRITGIPVDGANGLPQPESAAGGSQGQRLSPEQASKLPPGTPFIGMDGVPRTRH